MEEKQCKCPHCQKREEAEKENEEMGMAILVALVPLLVIVLFVQIGIL